MSPASSRFPPPLRAATDSFSGAASVAGTGGGAGSGRAAGGLAPVREASAEGGGSMDGAIAEPAVVRTATVDSDLIDEGEDAVTGLSSESLARILPLLYSSGTGHASTRWIPLTVGDTTIVLCLTFASMLSVLHSQPAFDVIVTHFGWNGENRAPTAKRVIELMRTQLHWTKWAPVVVCSIRHEWAETNRRLAMRAGAAAFATSYGEVVTRLVALVGAPPAAGGGR
jgi:hypothetical protein